MVTSDISDFLVDEANAPLPNGSRDLNGSVTLDPDCSTKFNTNKPFTHYETIHPASIEICPKAN